MSFFFSFWGAKRHDGPPFWALGGMAELPPGSASASHPDWRHQYIWVVCRVGLFQGRAEPLERLHIELTEEYLFGVKKAVVDYILTERPGQVYNICTM